MSPIERAPRFAAPVTSGTWELDIPAAKLYADEAFAELYGIEPSKFVEGLPSSSFFSAIHPEDQARIRIAVAGIVAGAELFSKEFRIVLPHGETMWVHARGQSHLDEEDQPVRFTGLMVDVTERKRAEERLRVAQNAGGVGTFEYNDGYATVAVSDEFCRLLGLHPAAILPVQTVNGVVRERGATIIPDGRNAAGVVGDLTKLDAVFEIERSDDGRRRWIARRGEIVRERAGYRLIGVIYDVTQSKELETALRDLNETLESRVQQEVANRRLAEDALRQAQKMEAIGQLTGGIAHDFNNLLMAISSSLALLRKRIPNDPQLYRMVDNAVAGTERGAALTQRMLAFARRQDLRSEPVDVVALIKDMSDLVRHTLGPAWTVDLNFAPQLPLVVADANQLEMAILNLAVNARDAMADGGTIRISVEEHDVAADFMADLGPGRYLTISVADTGCGMDQATLARATEPFFTTKGVGKGTGLGLSMIHGLASQLNGTFTITSELGKGTEAALWLPVTGEKLALATQTETAPGAIFRGMKILAVDDDCLILMNTASFLTDMGYEVIEADCGEKALEQLSSHPDIGLIITDQAMPNMTGSELAERVADLRPGMPIILATGYGELPKSRNCRMVKLAKPFNEDQLTAALAEALKVSPTDL